MPLSSAPFVANRRSVSPVIGSILLIAVVAVGLALIVGTGAFGVGQSEDSIESSAVEHELEGFASQAQPVVYGDSPQTTVSIDLDFKDGTTFTVDETAGHVTIDVGGSTVHESDLGMLVHELNGQQIAYQSGGVFKTTESGSQVVTRPGVSSSDGESGAERRYSLEIIQSTGNAAPSDEIAVSHVSAADAYPSKFVSAGDAVTITIESEFAEAWGSVLREQFALDAGQVSVNSDGTQMTATFAGGEAAFLQLSHYAIKIDSV